MQNNFLRWLLGPALASLLSATTWSIEIVVDYTYDTQDFFDQQYKKDALEEAAARYSRVITSSLTAVEPGTWQIGLVHPGTGEEWSVSTAPSVLQDPISTPADVYGFPGLEADQWILFAGGHDLESFGFGGSGTGTNFTNTLNEPNGPFHRGVISNTPDNTVNDLPAWGGFVVFDNGANWHFDLNTTAPIDEFDFYTIALHEIGHALGLSTRWNQWAQLEDGNFFRGSNAIAVYNEDNNASLSQLALVGGENHHWQNGRYDSFIFPLGEPNTVGTVGSAKQDLLLEPTANFSSLIRRFELTNVDAAALLDLGWSILEPEINPLDLNGDNQVNGLDVDLACAGGADLSPYFEELNSLLGDLDFDGSVRFRDFLGLALNFSKTGDYTDGDINCDGSVLFDDFLILAFGFGSSVSASHAVPEPSTFFLLLLCLSLIRPFRTSRALSR